MNKFGIIVILLLATIVLQCNEFVITKELTESELHMGFSMSSDEEKYDLDGNLGSLIIINCGIDDVNFTNSVSKISQKRSNGDYWVYLKSSAQRLYIRKSEGFGKYQYDFPFRLKSGSVYEMSVGAKEDLEEVSIPIMITTNPSGAEVFIDDEFIDYSYDGVLSHTLPAGKYEIKLSLKGFVTEVDSITVDEGKQTFSFALKEKLSAAVTITSDPEGAEIYLDNVYVGTTPHVTFFPFGEYDLRLVLRDYISIEDKINVVESFEKNYELTEASALLTINTFPNATIYINDELYAGIINHTKFKPQLLEIKVVVPQTEAIVDRVLLKPGDDIIKEYYPSISTGIIKVNVIPENARINLTNEEGFEYLSIGKETFKSLPVGEYYLKVYAKGKQTYEETIQLYNDKVVERDVILKSEDDYLKMDEFDVDSLEESE